MNEIAVEILIILLLIAANGLFALSEMAMVSARKTRLQSKAEDGDHGAATALALAEEPTRFLSTVQIGITTIGILSGAVGGATLAETIAASLAGIPWLTPYSEAVGVGIVVVAITFFSLVLGELAPKRLALNNPERIAAIAAAPLSLLSRLAGPVVALLSRSTELILRLVGAKPSSEPSITEEEVKALISEGAQVGIFETAEQEIVERVFRLADRRMSSLMTYRTDIVFLDIQDSLEENLDRIVESGFSRFPLCNGSPDEILGIIQVKDVFARQRHGEPIDLQALAHPAEFVLENISILALLEYLRRQKNHLALIIDEFGGITGLVTINDVLEAIVGDIPTLEDEIEEPDIIQREDGSFLLEGLLSTEDLKDLLNLDALPNEDTGRYETLGGMLMTVIGHIPQAGESITWAGWRFEIMDMDGYRVDKVLAAQLD